MHKSFPICYETFGNSNHPCIILIMGIGGQLISWPSLLTQGLVDKGFYVVTFDNRDAGLSRYYDELGIPNFSEIFAAKQQGKPFTPPYTLENMAADVIELMNELKIDKAHIAGISMGGIIAQYVAINYIDRVLSLTCIATTSSDPQLPPPKKEVLEFYTASMKTTQNQSEEFYIKSKLQLSKIYSHPEYFDEKKTKDNLLISFKRANHPNGFKRLLAAMICAEPRNDQLKKLKLPCLIIHGDDDPVFPVEHGKQLAELIAGSHLEIIAKMRHGLPDVACIKIVELIDQTFL